MYIVRSNEQQLCELRKNNFVCSIFYVSFSSAAIALEKKNSIELTFFSHYNSIYLTTNEQKNSIIVVNLLISVYEPLCWWLQFFVVACLLFQQITKSMLNHHMIAEGLQQTRW